MKAVFSASLQRVKHAFKATLVVMSLGASAYADIGSPYLDVNGDGLEDDCGRIYAGIACILGGTPSDGSMVMLWTTNFSDEQGWNKPYYGDTVQFADVNGDLLTDVCGRSARGVVCALSDGTRFGNWRRWDEQMTNQNGWADPVYYRSIRVDDVDGDGRADLCANGPFGYECRYSNGYVFL